MPTVDIFSFGDVLHGFAYNNYSYKDGMRYRGRSIGFSLDSDSTLLTLQAAWRDSDDWAYTLSSTTPRYPIRTTWTPTRPARSEMSSPPRPCTSTWARRGWPSPFRNLSVVIAGRLQDDQPRPQRGFQASIEAALTYAL
ncbi:MAG: hypothetical protein WDM81_19145 [Rhizomicrobium sp.]